jgi:hypothetical protein
VIHGEMRRRQQDEEDDPFTALRCQHAQSECCARLEDKVNAWRCIYSCTYCIYCFRKINHLVPVPFAFILCCKKPCREQYILKKGELQHNIGQQFVHNLTAITLVYLQKQSVYTDPMHSHHTAMCWLCVTSQMRQALAA